MQALAVETHYPSSAYQRSDDGELIKGADEKPLLKENAKGYRIKPLNSLQFMEVMMDGYEVKNGVNKMNSVGVKLLLTYGLEDASQISKIPALDLVHVAHAIYNKSALAESERKN